jgi:Ca2+:H+ antiporter
LFTVLADKYRREARFLSWYDDEGEPSSHNPFKKFRSNRRNSSVENGLRVKSAGDIRSWTERERRRGLGLGGPPAHPNTFPSKMPGTDQTKQQQQQQPDKIAESDKPGDSEQSHGHESNEISSSTYQLDEVTLRQRQRKKTLDLSESSYSAKDTASLQPPADQRKFTAIGQLRATLFNSWINLLLVAAPAGSKSA